MKVDIIKNGVRYYCTSLEQLEKFKAKGWQEVQPEKKEEPKPKRKTKKEE